MTADMNNRGSEGAILRLGADQLVRLMRLVFIVVAIIGGPILVTGLVTGKTPIITLGVLDCALFIPAYAARRLARAGHVAASVYTWGIGMLVLFGLMPLVSIGQMPLIVAGSAANLLLAALFISPSLIRRMAVILVTIVLISTGLEIWAPWPRLNLITDLIWIPMLAYPAAAGFIALLIDLLGKTLLQAAETAQANARQLEQSQIELGKRAVALEELSINLQQRNEEQIRLNQELQANAQQAERRAAQLAASAGVARAISQIRNLDQLLSELARLISDAFGYYHTGVFILDEINRYAVLRAANSANGQRMLANNYKLAVGSESPVGYASTTGQIHIARDTDQNTLYPGQPDLPDTHSEMALPLHVGQHIIGVLNVHSTQSDAFTEEDTAVLNMLADQVAIAIENTRLFEQAQAALQEAEESQGRHARQQWDRLLSRMLNASFEYHISGIPMVGNTPLPEIELALQRGEAITASGEEGSPAKATMAVPIKLAEQPIGVIDLHETEIDRKWSDEDIAFVTTIADQAALALENARLIAQTQQRAQREQLITQISAKIRNAPDVEGVLRTAIQEIRRAVGASQGLIQLAGGPSDQALPDRQQDGDHE